MPAYRITYTRKDAPGTLSGLFAFRGNLPSARTAARRLAEYHGGRPGEFTVLAVDYPDAGGFADRLQSRFGL